MLNTFQQKKIWITGASSGIGEALAHAFHKAGAKLVLSARREDELKRIQAQCGGESCTRVLPLDLVQAGELSDKARLALGMFSGIDVLVQNAGITQRSLVKDTDSSVYRTLMEINYFAPVALTKAVLPSMLEKQSGHFVVISSLVGKFGTPLRSGYAASKHALHGFFDSLRAEEGRRGINVTLVCPGFIRTDISLHALVGDGGKHGKMDKGQSQGMPAEQCAAEIVKGVAGHKREIYVGGRDKYLVYVKRFFPGILSRMVARAN